jgi:hypothetical protein
MIYGKKIRIKRLINKTRQKYNELFESFQLFDYNDRW